MICVPTPVDDQRRPEPAMVQAACASVVEHARAGQTLVLTSTTYVGSTREMLIEPLAERGLIAGRTSTSPSRPSGSTRASWATISCRPRG